MKVEKSLHHTVQYSGHQSLASWYSGAAAGFDSGGGGAHRRVTVVPKIHCKLEATFEIIVL